MFIVIAVLVLIFLALFFIVKFVLTNRAMFETTFDIILTDPFNIWSHTWEDVQFMYVIAGSVLLGAVLVAIVTWGLDTRRKFKLRSMRKELKRLQGELQQAQTLRQAQVSEKKPGPSTEISPEEEPTEGMDAASATPQDITQSFEDTIEETDFFEKSRKRREAEEHADAHGRADDLIRQTTSEAGDDIVTEPKPSAGAAADETETVDESQEPDEETPIEPEVVVEDTQKERSEPPAPSTQSPLLRQQKEQEEEEEEEVEEGEVVADNSDKQAKPHS
jgi:hypothetical protein